MRSTETFTLFPDRQPSIHRSTPWSTEPHCWPSSNRSDWLHRRSLLLRSTSPVLCVPMIPMWSLLRDSASRSSRTEVHPTARTSPVLRFCPSSHATMTHWVPIQTQPRGSSNWSAIRWLTSTCRFWTPRHWISTPKAPGSTARPSLATR